MRNITSWGRLNSQPHDVVRLDEPAKAPDLIADRHPGIAYGVGRSYGDVCLNPDGILWETTGMDHFIHFDKSSGSLVCEAGVLLRDIQRMVVPHGWILPVTPGTQIVTVGGAIANDVHGKNHHLLGSFGDHVQRIKLLRTSGEIIDCGPTIHADWFSATVGGLGLTGVIVEAQIQLRKITGPWLATETVSYEGLTEFFHLADDSEANWEHTVSWIDSLANRKARGLFMRGNPSNISRPCELKGRKLTVPSKLPFSLVNKLSLPLLNTAYFNYKKRQAGQVVEHYESFLYPLDNLLEWNRIYGPTGFFQYQSVVPRDVGQDAVRLMLDEVSRAGEGSFLAVLKTFGNRQPLGMMSFPNPGGVTLALDFPNKGVKTLKLFERLDAIVHEAGGRLYLAKDARMPQSMFEAGYPALNSFLRYRDPGVTSALSRRLMGS